MRFLILLLFVPALLTAQADTRVTDTIQSRGNPPAERVLRQPEQPPRDVRPQPPQRPSYPIIPYGQLPADRLWNSQRPTWDDCLTVAPQFRTVCMDRGTVRHQPPRRTTAFRERIRRATPQQQRAIQRARQEYRQKVQRILGVRR